MNTLRRIPLQTLLSLALVACAFAAPGAFAAESCSGRSHCSEVSTFVAAVSDFRTSAVGSSRLVTAVVSFQNKTDRPLVLGYVDGSGVVLDEHGNQYKVSGSNGVRGIGEIKRNTFDPRFTLQPGERSDARFELSFYPGQAILGVQFQLEMAIREIDSVTGNQHRLGREHALRFAGLQNNLAAASAAPSAAPAAVPASAGVPAATVSEAAPADPCAGKARCYATGPFIAEVVQLASGQKQGSNHAVRVGVRFRNVTNQPLVLAYQESSGTMLDNYGQQYTVDWRSTTNVSGIGITTRNKADAQFVLSPGEARTATFNYSRYVGTTALGTVFSPDLVVEQLEVLPSGQVRSVREYAVNFVGLAPGALAGAEAVNGVGEAARQIGEGLRSIFKKK